MSVQLKSREKSYGFNVKSFQVDRHSKLFLHQLFLFLQECAWNHAQENDFGYTFVEQEEALWVLSRVYVSMIQYPKWEEDIQIKTWPKAAKGLFAYRDFEVSRNGEIVGRVTSSWLVLDKKTRRPRKLSDFEMFQAEFSKENATNSALEKIILPNEIEKVADRSVQFSDIDVNAHVNNASYVRWIIDAVMQQRESLPVEFEINFLRELNVHQDFQVFISKEPDVDYAKIMNSQGKDICTAKVSF